MLRQQRESGLSIRAFCRSKNLSEPSFFAWRKRIQSVVEDRNDRPPLVAVDVVPSVDAGDAMIEIITAYGVTIRCCDNVDPTRLAGVIQAIGQIQSDGRSC